VPAKSSHEAGFSVLEGGVDVTTALSLALVGGAVVDECQGQKTATLLHSPLPGGIPGDGPVLVSRESSKAGSGDAVGAGDTCSASDLGPEADNAAICGFLEGTALAEFVVARYTIETYDAVS
jgi:hypothetical protein